MTIRHCAFWKKSPFLLPVLASLIVLGLASKSTMAQVWTKVGSVPTTQLLKGIVYANSQFVIVGSSGTILTSPDGAVWTLRTSGVSRDLYGVSASGSLFVIVGDSGTILSSPNGATWTKRTSNTTAMLTGIAYNGTTFVAAGMASAIVTSTNGTTWTARTLGSSTDLNGIAWGNNKFVVAGFDGMNGTINTSPTGTTWTKQTVDAADGLLSIAWCGNAFVAGSSGMVVSPDGIKWTMYSGGLEYFIFSATGHGNRAIAVGDGGSIYSSPDDSTWTSENSGTSVSLNCVTWGGTIFVAAGASGTILTSPLSSAVLHRGNTPGKNVQDITVQNQLVSFSLPASAIVTLRVYSAQGRLVQSMTRAMPKGEHSMPLSGLSPGNYLLSYQAGSRTIEKSFLVAR
jgi:hypothetical protein